MKHAFITYVKELTTYSEGSATLVSLSHKLISLSAANDIPMHWLLADLFWTWSRSRLRSLTCSWQFGRAPKGKTRCWEDVLHFYVPRSWVLRCLDSSMWSLTADEPKWSREHQRFSVFQLTSFGFCSAAQSGQKIRLKGEATGQVSYDLLSVFLLPEDEPFWL